MPSPIHLSLHLFPEGSVRTADDMARILARLGELLDAYAVLAALDVTPPDLQALDASLLLGALAEFARSSKPVEWSTELGRSAGDLVDFIVRAAERMMLEEEQVVGLHARTLRNLLIDLPAAWRMRGDDGAA